MREHKNAIVHILLRADQSLCCNLFDLNSCKFTGSHTQLIQSIPCMVFHMHNSTVRKFNRIFDFSFVWHLDRDDCVFHPNWLMKNLQMEDAIHEN